MLHPCIACEDTHMKDALCSNMSHTQVFILYELVRCLAIAVQRIPQPQSPLSFSLDPWWNCAYLRETKQELNIQRVFAWSNQFQVFILVEVLIELLLIQLDGFLSILFFDLCHHKCFERWFLWVADWH